MPSSSNLSIAMLVGTCGERSSLRFLKLSSPVRLIVALCTFVTQFAGKEKFHDVIE